ncbi:MAG: hypothetical protein JNK49_16485 [Planctomycetes bacterium]|nr:hypothetical protein [Planctomycetota bacterium]
MNRSPSACRSWLLRHAGGLALGVSCAGLAGCLATNPPAPAPRWFDPRPAAAALSPACRVAFRVTAAPHLGREFAVRTGERELAFDGLHQWLDTPRDVVEQAVARAFGPPEPGAPSVELHVVAFEIDRTATPRARVRLLWRKAGESVQELRAEAAAASLQPGDCAAAMALALAQLLGELAKKV